MRTNGTLGLCGALGCAQRKGSRDTAWRRDGHFGARGGGNGRARCDGSHRAAWRQCGAGRTIVAEGGEEENDEVVTEQLVDGAAKAWAGDAYHKLVQLKADHQARDALALRQVDAHVARRWHRRHRGEPVAAAPVRGEREAHELWEEVRR